MNAVTAYAVFFAFVAVVALGIFAWFVALGARKSEGFAGSPWRTMPLAARVSSSFRQAAEDLRIW